MNLIKSHVCNKEDLVPHCSHPFLRRRRNGKPSFAQKVRPKSPLPARFPNHLSVVPWPRVREKCGAPGRGCFWRFLELSAALGPGPGTAAAISALRRDRPAINRLTWSPLRRDSAKSPSRSLYSAIAAARPDPDSAGRPRWEKGDSALAGGGWGFWGSRPGGTCMGITCSHEIFPSAVLPRAAPGEAGRVGKAGIPSWESCTPL